MKIDSDVNIKFANLNDIKDIDLKDGFLLHIGGDHGVGLGSVCGILEHNPNTIVIWADAHADINHPVSSPSGHFHGMPLAFLTGIAKNQDFSWIKNYLPFENLILLGPRDLDPFEKELIHQCGINYISPFEVANEGIHHSIQRCLNKVDPYGLKSIHLSIAVDLIDPKAFSSTGTPVYGGPNEFEIIELGKIIAKTGRLKSLDIVEFNPELGDLENSIDVLYHFIHSTVSEAIRYQNVHQQIIHHFENQYRL